MPDSTEQAPTEVGPAANETEMMEVADFPETPQAWSAPADQWWNAPTRPAARTSARFQFRNGVKYAALAAVAVAVVWLLMVFMPERHQPQQSAPPTPAPPTATVAPWKPTAALDNNYIQALKDAGWVIDNQQTDLNNAHWSCKYLSQGHSKADLIGYWDRLPFPGEAPAQSHDDTVEWVGIVMNNMCPQFN